MNIEEPTPQVQHKPLWRLAFRPGFLFAAVFAVLAVGRWLLWMTNPGAWGGSMSPYWWHAHEMIFGFAMPVVAGFLLSAVATWTGLPGTAGTPLKILFGAWLLARATLWLLPSALTLAWAAEMAFIALLAFELGKRVWARRQWRNMLFLPVLLGLAVLCSLSYASADNPALGTRLHYGALWLIVALVVIVGGRVIPLFTANRLGLKIAPPSRPLEWLALASIVLVALLSTLEQAQVIQTALQSLLIVGFGIHVYRLARWQGWKTTKVPLLWSMHISYLCIPLSLLGLLWAGDNPIAIKNVMHLLGVGTVGGMILSMMSRVSLGHTGRPLETPRGIAAAFALVFLAAFIRAFVPLFDPALSALAWQISAGLWIVAFALFFYRYLPILSQPRADGKPG